jgi:hypothetical protein
MISHGVVSHAPTPRQCHGIRIEGSSRFLKKAAQKLFLCWAMGVVSDKASSPG